MQAPRTSEPVPLKDSPSLMCLRASRLAILAAAEPTESQRTAVAEYDRRVNMVLDIARKLKTTPVDNSVTVNNQDSTTFHHHSNEKPPLPASTPSCHHAHKVKKPAQIRKTCEGCRKLKIRCVPSTDDASCEKCQKRGTACIFLPRAGYRTRKVRTKI